MSEDSWPSGGDAPNDSNWFPLVAHLPLAVLIETEDRQVSLTNRPFCLLFDLQMEPAEFIGADSRAALAELAPIFEDPISFMDRVEEIVEAGEPCEEETVKLADGRVLLRDFITSRSASGAKRNVWLYRDVTRQMQAEDAIRMARDQALGLATQRADLISLVSHEIRTPLSGTVGLVDLLLNQPLPPAVHGIVTSIQQSAADVIALLEDLLDLSRMDVQSLTLSFESTDISVLVEKAAETVGKAARAKNLAVSTLIASDVPARIWTDPLRLRQVLLNILGNAIKFTPSGEIAVQVATDEQGLRISVIDTGPGITESERKELFTPFAQGKAALDVDVRGAGLGLALSERLMDLMGGEIGVESEVRHGTSFHIFLPQDQNNLPMEPHRRLEVLADMTVLLTGSARLASKALAHSLEDLGAQVTHDEAADWDAAVLLVCQESELQEALTITAKAESNKKISAILTPDENLEGNDSIRSPVSLLPIRSERLVGLLTGTDQHEVAVAKKIAKFGGTSRVLVVDDAPANRTLLEAMLQLLNVDVQMARDGQEGLAAVQSEDFDVVLMDVNMPVMDGLEATRAIREYETGRRTPIIALTASALAGDRQACLDAGMDNYVKKPVSLPELRLALSKFLDEPEETDLLVPAEVSEEWALKTKQLPFLDQGRVDELIEELGDEEIVRESLQIFMESMPERIAAIEALLSPDGLSDRAEVRRVVHALGSPAAMLGAVHLAEKCKLVEALAGSERAIAHGAVAEIVDSSAVTSATVTQYLQGKP
jgi:two-component system sensor histidine kinase/response regulator